jgi:hypothetical protein
MRAKNDAGHFVRIVWSSKCPRRNLMGKRRAGTNAIVAERLHARLDHFVQKLALAPRMRRSKIFVVRPARTSQNCTL